MTNERYGKLVNNYPKPLRLPIQLTADITIDGVVHPSGSWLSTDDEDAILELGYKPIVNTEPPANEGFYYTEKWEETDTAITKIWEEHEMPVYDNPNDIIDILTGEV